MGKKKIPVHIWVGTFKSEEELEEYADNSGEDCPFCCDYLLTDAAADEIGEKLECLFFKEDAAAADLVVQALGQGFLEEARKACRENQLEGLRGNVVFMLEGWEEKHSYFRERCIKGLTKFVQKDGGWKEIPGEVPRAIYVGMFLAEED